MYGIEYYIETSIWNFLFVEDSPEKRSITIEFFKKMDERDIYVSQVVLDEIARTSEPRLSELSNAISSYQPEVLPAHPEILNIANEYIDRDIFTEKYRDDAVHIAYACYYGIDAIISWNFKHIVRLKTKREVKSINVILGLNTPNIVSPEEVLYG